MSEINIEHPHQMDVNEVKHCLEALVSSLKEKYGVSANWEDETQVRFKAPSVGGVVSFDQSQLNIAVKFGFFAAMLKPKVEAEIRQYLDANIT